MAGDVRASGNVQVVNHTLDGNDGDGVLHVRSGDNGAHMALATANFTSNGNTSITGNAVVGGTLDIGYQVVTAAQSGSGHFTVDVTCPAGKKVLGGGCSQEAGVNRGLVDSSPQGNNGWHCHGRDISNTPTVTLTAYAICARVL